MDCEAALKYGAGPIGFATLNPSYLTVLLRPANFTLMFYDYFLTIGLESQFVWSSKRSLAKALYFATTYFNFTNLVASAPGFMISCSRIPRTNSIFEVSECRFIFTASERLSFFSERGPLWERNKKTGIGLLGLFAFLSIPFSTFIAFGIRQQDTAGSQPLIGSITFFGFVLLAFYESVMFGLNIYKAKQHFAATPNQYFPLTLVLLRDGILYYIFLISFSLVITGFLVTGNLPIVVNLSLLHVTFHSVLTKRMFLNLRSAAFKNSSESWVPNSSFMAVSGLQFASKSDTII
ncbi:hypothetical protein K439DRAFT_1664608 [Ramaria rubella]|nr:hypothetical protein K439DRAFT_1664608 [Ramaria rubella]